MSTRERVEALLQEVLPRIQEIEDASLERISAAKADAREKISRHEAATGELEEVEDRIEDLRVENAELPVLHSRAVLDDDVDEELRIKQRAQDLKAEVEALEARRDELWKEIGSLLKNDRGHRLDAMIEHTAGVAEIAQAEREPLEMLRDRLAKAAGSAADAVAHEHEQARGQVRAWSTSIEFERSPAYGTPPGLGRSRA